MRIITFFVKKNHYYFFSSKICHILRQRGRRRRTAPTKRMHQSICHSTENGRRVILREDVEIVNPIEIGRPSNMNLISKIELPPALVHKLINVYEHTFKISSGRGVTYETSLMICLEATPSKARVDMSVPERYKCFFLPYLNKAQKKNNPIFVIRLNELSFATKAVVAVTEHELIQLEIADLLRIKQAYPNSALTDDELVCLWSENLACRHIEFLIKKNSTKRTSMQTYNLRANKILNNVESIEDPVLVFERLAAEKAALEETEDGESILVENVVEK